MILLDWTRMGKTYCLAGAVAQGRAFRVVRPILARGRDAPVRNVGWSPFLLDGHTRWEIFTLDRPLPTPPEPPHLEDLWVRTLKPLHSLASPQQRRDILAATGVKPGEPLFGTDFGGTQFTVSVAPGTGQRSLATLVVPAKEIVFRAWDRVGAPDRDYRVELPIPLLGRRCLAVKDHHLLRRAELASTEIAGQVKMLTYAVQQMGDRVAIRLGLSRPFHANDSGPGACWLMADGFFSLVDPQP
jgi:hypothetical protein